MSWRLQKNGSKKHVLDPRATMLAMLSGGALSLIGHGCTLLHYKEEYCSNRGGNRYCEERYPDREMYCYFGSQACIAELEQEMQLKSEFDGCVEEQPPDACYSPCGGQQTVSSSGDCVVGGSAAGDDVAEGTVGDAGTGLTVGETTMGLDGSASGDPSADGDDVGDGSTGDDECGNGVVEGEEGCDAGGESPLCNADCTVSVCGDGIVNTAAMEECDGADLAGATCLSLGFGIGTLACNACSFDTSACYVDSDGDGDPDQTDCDPHDSAIHHGAVDTCNGLDDDCSGLADEDHPCELATVSLTPPLLPPIEHPTETGLCGRFAVMSGVPGNPDPSNLGNISAYMNQLDTITASENLYASVDFGNFGLGEGCVAVGDFMGATPLPVEGPGNFGGRWRGYLNIPAPMAWTLAISGRDAVEVHVGGTPIATLSSAADDAWKRTVGISFPEGGLYPLEIQWTSNRTCSEDFLEFSYALSVIPGDNDTAHCDPEEFACGWSAEDNGYTLLDGDWLVPTIDGSATPCEQCNPHVPCSGGAVCNDAGICE